MLAEQVPNRTTLIGAGAGETHLSFTIDAAPIPTGSCGAPLHGVDFPGGPIPKCNATAHWGIHCFHNIEARTGVASIGQYLLT